MARLYISKQKDLIFEDVKEHSRVDYEGEIRLTFLDGGKHLGDSVMLQVEHGERGTESGLWLETCELIEAVRKACGFSRNADHAERVEDEGTGSGAIRHMRSMREQSAVAERFLRDLLAQIETDLPRYDAWIEDRLDVSPGAAACAPASFRTARLG